MKLNSSRIFLLLLSFAFYFDFLQERSFPLLFGFVPRLATFASMGLSQKLTSSVCGNKVKHGLRRANRASAENGLQYFSFPFTETNNKRNAIERHFL